MPQLRQYEKPEFTIRGPFGGILSEVPIDAIESLGFADALNVVFRQGAVSTRPGYETMPGVDERIVGVFTFFDETTNRISGIMTPTSVYKWVGASSSWEQITGVLHGGAKQIVSWDVNAHKLLFSQGVDKVQVWDGSTPGFADVSANAVPARFVAEVDFHTVLGYTIEGGSTFAQRIRWCGIGDPTDYVGFGAGATDLFNNLGPVTGIVKLYQSGYAFQYWGITQIVPTGIGTKPFDFVQMSAHSKGNAFPYSLASFGESVACYAGVDNIYMFNGTRSDPIGDFPIQGNLRGGALSRIYSDLQASDPATVFGLITSTINGTAYNAYWLFIPGTSVWLFNFKEANWTRFVFNKQPSMCGIFNLEKLIRIKDLIGPISAQNWTPATLVGISPLDVVLIGFEDGTPATFDFSGISETAWSLSTGQLVMGDYRHRKTVRRWRLVLRDVGFTQFTMIFRNEFGDTERKLVTLDGDGTNQQMLKIVETNISGVYITVRFDGTTDMNLSEITPIYDLSGEHKGTG